MKKTEWTKVETYVNSRWMLIVPFALALFLTTSFIYSQSLFFECEEQSIVDCGPYSVSFGLEDKLKSSTIVYPSPDDYLRRGTARVIFRFLVWADVLAVLFATIGFLIIIGKWLGRYVVIATFLISLIVTLGISVQDQMPVTTPLATVTIEAGFGGMTNFINMSKWLNGIGFFATLILAFTFSALLYVKPGTRGKQIESLEILQEKRKHLSGVLYLATVLLIVGLLRNNAGVDWARSFLTPNTPDLLKDFLSTISTELGAFWSLLLAATYLPTAFALQKRAETAFTAAHPTEAMPEGLTALGFNFSLKEAIPRILAIAGPLLTGAIADALTRSLPK